MNFTRSGNLGKEIKAHVLFFNAAVQGMDKLGRSFYERGDGLAGGLKRSGKTTGKAMATLTAVSLMNYFRNRDEEWWKKLPPYEKWGYMHVKLPGFDQPLRIPYPFEFGLIFGALPIAALEDRRNPGGYLGRRA